MVFISNARNPSIPNATAANNGTYTLYLEKGDCQLEESFDVDIIFYDLPTLNLTGDNNLCSGENLSINSNATNANSYNWTGPNNFSSTAANINISNVSTSNSGLYELTATSADGCTTTSAIDVTIFDIEPITIVPETVPCSGGEINLATSETIDNIGSQTWSGPNNFSSSLTFPTISNVSDIHSGTYSVTVTYETGCQATASLDINVGTAPNIEIESNNPSCVEETLMLAQTGDTGTHLWIGPNNFSSTNASFSIQNLISAHQGTYTVTLTGTTGGCTASESITVNLSALPTPVLSSSGAFCEGDAALTLEVSGVANGDIDWIQPTVNSSFTESILTINNPTEINSGNYSVSVTNSAGCTALETINVGFKGVNPSLNIVGEEAVCIGTTIDLAENSTAGMNHSWTGPNDFSAEGSSIQIDNIAANAAGEYIVTADNGNGCQSSLSTNITVNDMPIVVGAVSVDEICEGANLTLQETGGDLVEWNWTGPNNFTSSAQNPALTNIALNASGTYIVSGTDANGCTSESSIAINVQAVFNAGTGTNRQVCEGTTVDLQTLLNDADEGGVFTDVSNTGNLNDGIFETENLSPGNYSFIYTLASNSSCITQANIVINVQELLSAGADVSLSECQGTTIDLLAQLSGADEGGTFIDVDNSGGLNGNTFTTTNLNSGTYNLMYQIGGGLCPTDEASISINLIAIPETPQLNNVTSCGGGSVLLAASEEMPIVGVMEKQLNKLAYNLLPQLLIV